MLYVTYIQTNINQNYTIEYSIIFKKLLMHEIQGVKDCSNIHKKKVEQ